MSPGEESFAFHGIVDLQDTMFKDGSKILRIEARHHPKNPLAIKTAIRTKDMAMRVKPQKIQKHLERDDRSRNRTPLGILAFEPIRCILYALFLFH